MTDNIYSYLVAIDWKLLFAGLALLLSLYNFLENKRVRRNQKDYKKKETRIEIDKLLDDAWDLMGGNLESEKINDYSSLNRLNQAKRLIARCENMDANYAPVFRLWSLYYRGLKDYGEALLSSQKAIAIDPENPLYYEHRGAALLSLNRFEEAEKDFRKSTELAPKDAVCFYNLGTALQSIDRIEDSEKAFQKAIELGHDDIEIHTKLGSNLVRLGRIKEAEKSFRRVTELDLDNALAHRNLGLLFSLSDRHKDAEKSFRKSIDLDPGDAVAYELLGTTYCALECFEAAENALRKSISLDPQSSRGHYNLGYALLSLVNSDYFDFGFGAEFHRDKILYGRMVDRMHQLVEAKKAFKKVIELEPKNDAASFGLDMTLGLLERYKEAIEALQSLNNNKLFKWASKHVNHDV